MTTRKDYDIADISVSGYEKPERRSGLTGMDTTCFYKKPTWILLSKTSFSFSR